MSNKISLEFLNKELNNIDDSIEVSELQKFRGGNWSSAGFMADDYRDGTELDSEQGLKELYGKLAFADSEVNLDVLRDSLDVKNMVELINNYVNSGTIFKEFKGSSFTDIGLQEMIQTVYNFIAENQEVFSSFKTYSELIENAERLNLDGTFTSLDFRRELTAEAAIAPPTNSSDNSKAAPPPAPPAAPTTRSDSTSASTTDTWLTNSNNVLIQLMLIILQIFNECLNSLAVRGSQLSEVQESLSAINDASVTFTQLAAAIAIAPEGVNSMHELFTVAGTVNNSGNLVYPELYGLVQPIASEMGMKIVIPTTPASGMSAGTVTAIDGTTTLSTDTVHSNVNDYFDDLNELVVSIGKEPIVFPDPSNVYGSSVKAVSDELNAAALYAGNISQNMMQEMKVLQDYLSIYMQAAANATTTNKEANQAVFR